MTAAVADELCRGTAWQLRQINVDLVVPRQATFEFALQLIWVLQNGANVCPHGGIESVQTNRFVLTDACPAEAERIHADATIVGVRCCRIGRKPRTAFAVVGIATAATFQQSLEQIARTTLPLSRVFVILGQLFGDGVNNSTLISAGTGIVI
jgi:hypothetical protein